MASFKKLQLLVFSAGRKEGGNGQCLEGCVGSSVANSHPCFTAKNAHLGIFDKSAFFFSLHSFVVHTIIRFWLYQTGILASRNCCPTTNSGMQNKSSVGIYTDCIHAFAHLAPICMLSQCLAKKKICVGAQSEVY